MYPQSALMESSDYHAGENSLSFIALCPLASIGINSGIVTTTYPDNTRREEPLSQSFRVENALNNLDGVWAQVDLGSRKAIVRTKQVLSEDTLREVVQKVGYLVLSVQPGQSEAREEQ